jgi:hypothetical protein
MRLVTAVTTAQTTELFPAKKSALGNRIFVRAATSYRQRLVRVGRVGLAVDQRFLVYPDDRMTFSVPVGQVSRGPRAAIGIFCRPSLSSGSSAAECPRFDVDQIRLSQ